jgi:hypothetical protein
MSNVNSFVSVQLTVPLIPATETVVLFPNRSADTTRANSLAGPDFAFADGSIQSGRPFRIRLSGSAVATASENLSFAVYLNKGGNTNLTTFTSDIKVVDTSTMATGAAGTLAFTASALCVWNSTSSTAGRFAFANEVGVKSISGTSATIPSGGAAIGNSGTAITCTVAQCQFYVTALTGTADTGSSAILDFSIEQV